MSLKAIMCSLGHFVALVRLLGSKKYIKFEKLKKAVNVEGKYSLEMRFCGLMREHYRVIAYNTATIVPKRKGY